MPCSRSTELPMFLSAAGSRRPKKLLAASCSENDNVKVYNLSRQSQTHSGEITNTFVTRLWGCPSTFPLPLPMPQTSRCMGRSRAEGGDTNFCLMWWNGLAPSLPVLVLSWLSDVLFVVLAPLAAVVVAVVMLFYAFTALRGSISVKLAQTPLLVA